MKTAIYLLAVFVAWVLCYGVNIGLENAISDKSIAFTLGFMVSVLLSFGTVFAGCQLLDLWGKRA